MKRRFLYLETDGGSILFPTLRRLLDAQLKQAEMVMEEFTDPQKALATVLGAPPEDAWFILTCYDVKDDVHAMTLIRGVRGRQEPPVNAYIVLLAGFDSVNDEIAGSLGANTAVSKREPLRIPLDREFHRFVNFARKARRNSQADFAPPSRS